MAVAGELEAHHVGDVPVDLGRAQSVVAQARGVVIGVVHAFDRRRIGVGGAVAGGIGLVDVGHLHRRGPLAADVVPVGTEPVDHPQRHVLVIVLPPPGGVDPGGQGGRADRLDELGVQLGLLLGPDALPLLPVLVAVADVAAPPAGQVAGLQPGEQVVALGAALVPAVAALGEAAQLVARIDREELDCAAQVGAGGGAQRAHALRQLGPADVLRGDRPADVQAVVVAVAHVPERDVVEGEAELVLVEAAHGDPRRPLVGAEGIGGLEVHAGQLGQHLDRADAGRLQQHVLLHHRLHLAGLALAIDHHLAHLRGPPGGGGWIVVGGRQGRSRDQQRAGRRAGHE